MKKNALLVKYLEKANKAAKWLKKSQIKCEKIDLAKDFSDSEVDALENLSSRFARHSDILFQKVFRLLDQIELEPQKSMLDTLHKASKRGLAEESTLEMIRETRNAIAHEYAEDNLTSLFEEIQKFTPLLLELQDKTEKYCKKFTG